MAARIERVVMLPWDGNAFPFVLPYQGIQPEAFPEPPPEVFANGGAFRLGDDTTYALYGRARGWKLSGPVRVQHIGGGYVEGALSLPIPAVRFSDGTPGIHIELADEEEVSQHGGWFGEDLEPELWTYHGDGDPEDFNIGYIAFQLGEELGGDPGGFTFKPKITMGFELEDVAVSIQVGRGTLADGCTAGARLPITKDGSFDGYDQDTTFDFQLGSYTPDNNFAITGDLLFEPNVWWEYDTRDGNGPVYDLATGAWKRSEIPLR